MCEEGWDGGGSSLPASSGRCCLDDGCRDGRESKLSRLNPIVPRSSSTEQIVIRQQDAKESKTAKISWMCAVHWVKISGERRCTVVCPAGRKWYYKTRWTHVSLFRCLQTTTVHHSTITDLIIQTVWILWIKKTSSSVSPLPHHLSLTFLSSCPVVLSSWGGTEGCLEGGWGDKWEVLCRDSKVHFCFLSPS